MSVYVETFGTGTQDAVFLEGYVRAMYDLTPTGIIKELKLTIVLDFVAEGLYVSRLKQ